MPKAIIVNVGDKFGKLSVVKELERVRSGGSPKRFFELNCDCGNTTRVSLSDLRSSKTQSCGCIKKELMRRKQTKHGKSGDSVYNTWSLMKARCYKVSDRRYQQYGGRGIKICQRWRESFDEFYKDMGDKPKGRYSIDRVNVNGHYSCGRCEECLSNGWAMNCRWATDTEQARNRRSNNVIKINGIEKCLTEWCEFYNVSRDYIKDKVYKAKSPEEIEEIFLSASRRQNF